MQTELSRLPVKKEQKDLRKFINQILEAAKAVFEPQQPASLKMGFCRALPGLLLGDFCVFGAVRPIIAQQRPYQNPTKAFRTLSQKMRRRFNCRWLGKKFITHV
jgi:hypothetical protein